jgi:hypothetical protein
VVLSRHRLCLNIPSIDSDMEVTSENDDVDMKDLPELQADIDDDDSDDEDQAIDSDDENLLYEICKIQDRTLCCN